MTAPPIQNCGKCGLCLSVCPVYQVLKQEQASPRARLQLIKAFEKKDLDASPLLKDLVSQCLMCGACKVVCPSGINHYGKFMDMREQLARSLPEPPAIRSLVYLLAKEYRLRMGAGLARFGQRLTPKFLADKYRIGNIPVHRFPTMNAAPFRQTLPDVIPARGIRRGRVIYFVGCATQYLFGDTGQATVDILSHLGYEVVVPKGLTCCGIPMMFHGARDRAALNMAANLTAMADAFDNGPCDAVIVDCTTCGAALKDEYPGLMDTLNRRPDPALSGRLDILPPDIHTRIAGKTRDILSFVHEHQTHLEMRPDLSPNKVIYHAPCHTRNSFNTAGTVTDLLATLPCFDYIPVRDTAACCGGGGTFFYEYPEIAAKMMAGKLCHARDADAQYWLTDCPVCRINLHGSLSEQDRLTVVHPVTLISRGLDA
ncbi:MAG: (Fe-S)-binding protein [Desulfotignum sp.]|nr:(Fe-S)-binding protein [Desulfotignum sp.]MCF8088309.1 (Fe-S)-binding protein [Desulfotignum sp.]MCF8137687.1 (Fe-S)-binding protein [Desulfotignum sp.]